jgi:hypothetical protein
LGLNEQYEYEPLSNVQEPLVKMHKHLVDISHLARKSYDELMRHHSGYEQAYLSERSKLMHNVAAYEALALEKERLDQENQYCKQQLLPEYDRLFRRQEQEIQETQKEVRDSQARNWEIEKKNHDEAEIHKSIVDTMAGLLRVKDQRIEELESEVKERKAKALELSSTSCPSSDRLQPLRTGKRQRSSKLEQDTSTQRHGDPAKRSRKCKQTKLNGSQE